MGMDLLTNSRQGLNKQHLLVPLLRQAIYSRLAGYEDVYDAERLAVDSAIRHVVGGRAARADKEAASPSGVGRFVHLKKLVIHPGQLTQEELAMLPDCVEVIQEARTLQTGE